MQLKETARPDASANELAVYLPRTLRHFLARRDGPITRPVRDEFAAAVLLVDVAGFSAFAEQLAVDGLRGAERLSEVLNAFFGRMIELIHAHGGDVWLFAGDAAHVLWPADSATLEQQASRAAQCALELQRVLPQVETQGLPPLRLRASIGVGRVRHDQLGGINGRWHPFLSGEALAQAVEHNKAAAPGEVILSREALAHVKEHAIGEPLNSGALRLRQVRALTSPPPLAPAHAGSAEVIRPYVLPVVAERLAAGQTEYLAEFRSVTVLFVHLSSLDGSADLDRHQQVVALVQEQLERFEGTLYQCLHDEKGTTVVAAFGLPPLAHDKASARAVEAALALREQLNERGQRVGIGIATGRSFCGGYGHPTRRQYSIVGTTINLAARLMQATNGDGLICDRYTRDAARSLAFGELEPVTVKGFQTPVRIFRPEGRSTNSGRQGVVLIGRDAERRLLAERLRLLSSSQGGLVVIRGEAGLGKSVLFDHLHAVAQALGVTLYRGEVESLESQTPYFPWRSIIAGWLRLSSATVAAARARIGELLRHDEELLTLAPLLDAVLPLDWPDNELTRQMTGQIRADNLQKLLLALATRIAAAPTLITLEDVHWMDSASWAFLRLVRQRVPSLLIAVTLRPMSEPPAELRALLDERETLLLDLKPLDTNETGDLLKLTLAVHSVPDPVRKLILTKAEGNPFYSEELALALRDAGILEINGGECTLVGGERGLERAHLPDTLQGVITNRIDRLSPPVQLTLKVASVIGRSFEQELLAGIHPLEPTRDSLEAYLAESERSAMITPEPEATYAFRHAVTHETTYNLLLFAHRKALHRAVAEYLERRHAADLSPVQARLAHHWTFAEVPHKAAEALSKAGEQALNAYANEEAVDFFTRALELDAQARLVSAVDQKRARWHSMLGQAHYSLVHHDESLRHLEQSVVATGFRPPQGGARVLADVGRYLTNRVRKPSARTEGDLSERCQLALEALDILAPMQLWKGDKIAFAHTVLTGRNIADIAGPSARSAYAIGQFAYLLAIAGLRGPAEREFRVALAMAEGSDGILQVVSLNVLWGMFLTMVGRPEEAIAPQRRAVELVERLNAGLWKHRSHFMLGEALHFAGSYAASRDHSRVAATLSIAAEEHAAGFAHSMAALANLRLGHVDEALRELTAPDGVPRIRRQPVPLSLFASLGALAEAHLAAGDLHAALDAAREAEALLKPGQECNDYFAGLHGFAGIAATYLILWERLVDGSVGPVMRLTEAKKQARIAVQRLHKLAKMYPGAKPRADLFEGWLQRLEGSLPRARKSWSAAAQLAERMGLPYEHGLALLWLGRSAAGAEQSSALTRAAVIFERHGMQQLLAECRTAQGASPPLPRTGT